MTEAKQIAMNRIVLLTIVALGLTDPCPIHAFSSPSVVASAGPSSQKNWLSTSCSTTTSRTRTCQSNENQYVENNEAEHSMIRGDALTRRSLLAITGSTSAALVVPGIYSSNQIIVAHAAAFSSDSTKTAVKGVNVETIQIDPSQARVTKKVFFNVRISRQDGTFYVRDDLPDTPENQVFTGQIVIGLFGDDAPDTVARFLSYLPVNQSPADDNPLPSYSRSIFTRFDEATGVLYGGTIPALDVTEFGGGTAVRYGGRLIPATLWIERGSKTKIRHAAKGLLTHKILDVTPVFGITTRSDTTAMDGSYTVFGQIIPTEGSTDFLSRIQDIPTYALERPPYMSTGSGNDVIESSAQAVFNAQREFFRNTAKSFGDTRIDQVYQGKLLRRVEVTQVGFL